MSSFCFSIDGKEDERSSLEAAVSASDMTVKAITRAVYDPGLGRVSLCMESGLSEDDHRILIGLMSALTDKGS